jgi:hypothetical protein
MEARERGQGIAVIVAVAGDSVYLLLPRPSVYPAISLDRRSAVGPEKVNVI